MNNEDIELLVGPVVNKKEDISVVEDADKAGDYLVAKKLRPWNIFKQINSIKVRLLGIVDIMGDMMMAMRGESKFYAELLNMLQTQNNRITELESKLGGK